jgi:hypothetical protein
VKGSSSVPSITDVLKEISDDKALTLFNSIAISDGHRGDNHLREMNLSKKQYYSRRSGLIDAGLIRRYKGKYYLTLLGKVVYYCQMIIDKTLSYYWKLKAIESIGMSSDTKLPEEELTQLINDLIDNHFIKDILIKEPLSYTLTN